MHNVAILVPALALSALVAGPARAADEAPGPALNQALPLLGSLFGLEISTAGISHAELIIFGALIVWFLIVEPHGLAKLWCTAKMMLRLWPCPQ